MALLATPALASPLILGAPTTEPSRARSKRTATVPVEPGGGFQQRAMALLTSGARSFAGAARAGCIRMTDIRTRAEKIRTANPPDESLRRGYARIGKWSPCCAA